MTFQRNVLHVDASRFNTLCDSIKGLVLEKAFLELKWHRKGVNPLLYEALAEALVKAKESGFDLQKTYVGGCFTNVLQLNLILQR